MKKVKGLIELLIPTCKTPFPYIIHNKHYITVPFSPSYSFASHLHGYLLLLSFTPPLFHYFYDLLFPFLFPLFLLSFLQQSLLLPFFIFFTNHFLLFSSFLLLSLHSFYQKILRTMFLFLYIIYSFSFLFFSHCLFFLHFDFFIIFHH